MRCELCRDGWYEWEKGKRDAKVSGGSLCCRNGKNVRLEIPHAPKVPETRKCSSIREACVNGCVVTYCIVKTPNWLMTMVSSSGLPLLV